MDRYKIKHICTSFIQIIPTYCILENSKFKYPDQDQLPLIWLKIVNITVFKVCEAPALGQGVVSLCDIKYDRKYVDGLIWKFRLRM